MGTLKSTFRKLSIRAAMFLTYLFAGAGIFLAIEKNAAAQKQKEEKWMNVTLQFRLNHNITEEEFKKFEDEMKQAVKDNVTLSWSYVNAFLFCYNVITTIGYGHITPKTTEGRLLMIVYALVGIPLTGYCLRFVGNEMTTFFGYMIRYFERRVFNREAERLELKCVYISSGSAVFMIIMGGIIFKLSEKNRSLLDGIYFSFVTLTTIGFGDMVHESSNTMNDDITKLTIEILLLVFYVIGLSIMSSVIVSITAVIEDKTKKLDDPMEAIRNLRIENLNSKAMKKLGYKVDENYNISNGVIDEKRRGTIVPADDPVPTNKMARGSCVLSNINLNLIRNACNRSRHNSKSSNIMNNNNACNNAQTMNNGNNNTSNINSNSSNMNGNTIKNSSSIMNHNRKELVQNEDGVDSTGKKEVNGQEDVNRDLEVGVDNHHYHSSIPNTPEHDKKKMNKNDEIKYDQLDEMENAEVSSIITEYDGVELYSTSGDSKTTIVEECDDIANSAKSVYISLESSSVDNKERRNTGGEFVRPSSRLCSSRETTSRGSGLLDVSSNIEINNIQRYSSNLHTDQQDNRMTNCSSNPKLFKTECLESEIDRFYKIAQSSPNHLTKNHTNALFDYTKQAGNKKLIGKTNPMHIISNEKNEDNVT